MAAVGLSGAYDKTGLGAGQKNCRFFWLCACHHSRQRGTMYERKLHSAPPAFARFAVHIQNVRQFMLFAIPTFVTILLLGIVAVLIFGKRLPEIARALGKSITEFKKGAHGLESGFDDIINPHTAPTTQTQQPAAPAEAIRPPQRVAPTAPKFDDVP